MFMSEFWAISSNTRIYTDNTNTFTNISKSYLPDHSKGFGGKFGVQTDRKDASAVGYDHQEKLEKHESQKGLLLNQQLTKIFGNFCIIRLLAIFCGLTEPYLPNSKKI